MPMNIRFFPTSKNFKAMKMAKRLYRLPKKVLFVYFFKFWKY